MVTLVAVRRQWLWVMTKLILVLEDILLPEPKSYLTIDNPQNICEGVTTTTLQKDVFNKSWSLEETINIRTPAKNSTFVHGN